jgi:hypothetical protein
MTQAMIEEQPHCAQVGILTSYQNMDCRKILRIRTRDRGREQRKAKRHTKNDTNMVSTSSFIDPSFFVICIEKPSCVFLQIIGNDDYQPRYEVLIKGRG